MAPSHVIVVPLSLHGHLNPLLQLSVKLALRDITVSFIVTHNTLYRTSQLLSSLVEDPSQEDLVQRNIKFLSIAVEADEVENLEAGNDVGIWANLMLLHNRADEIHQLVQKSIEDHGPASLLIMDHIAVPMLKPVSTKLEALKVAFWTASSTFLLLGIHLRTLVQRGYLPLQQSGDIPHTLDDSVVEGIPALKIHDVPFCWHEEPPEDPGFLKTGSVRKFAFEASYVLINTFQELENDSILAMKKLGVKVLPVGPLLTPVKRQSRKSTDFDELFTWLSSREARSVVYVSFGTMARMDDVQQVQELACALEKLLESYSFLWIVHQETMSILPEGFEQRVNCRRDVTRCGFICSWCPQVEVLRHPSVGVFVTHCGWNSMVESVCCGVPMVAWPCFADQSLNGKYVEDVWKVGRRIHRLSKQGLRETVILKEKIVTAVLKVMEDGDMREQAAKWRAEAEKALEVGGSYVEELAQLIKGNW